MLGVEPLAIGDLIMTEVLQGIHPKELFEAVLKQLETFELVEIGGRDVAVQAARNYQFLRARGATVRKTIDTLIASRCIMDGISLLHSDRDFDPFVIHLGLTTPVL
jgi:predicted nucleic acid-binding protein